MAGIWGGPEEWVRLRDTDAFGAENIIQDGNLNIGRKKMIEILDMKLNVTITKTSTGKHDYIQIMSDDMTAINIVLIAGEIDVKDHRPKKKDS